MLDILDESFGLLRLPEKIEPWEKGRSPASLAVLDEDVAACLAAMQQLAQNRLLKPSARAKTYIWAVDARGTIQIAIEELAAWEQIAQYAGYPRRRGFHHPSEEKKLGHPTLLGEMGARIAGELAFDEIDDKLHWVLNANSGRYCRSLPPSKEQLDRVAAIFRELGVGVTVDYDL
nr:hypothetical protein [uncultured Gellertiella sp.]